MPTESQLQDSELRQRVAEHIDARRLPLILPSQIAAVYGKGQRCAACGLPITSKQVEYEVQGFRPHTEHALWMSRALAD